MDEWLVATICSTKAGFSIGEIVWLLSAFVCRPVLFLSFCLFVFLSFCIFVFFVFLWMDEWLSLLGKLCGFYRPLCADLFFHSGQNTFYTCLPHNVLLFVGIGHFQMFYYRSRRPLTTHLSPQCTVLALFKSPPEFQSPYRKQTSYMM